MGYYLTGVGPSLRDELTLSLKEIEATKPKVPEDAFNDATLYAAVADPGKVKHGAEVFAGKCVACHGDKGQGLIGPNLTDDYWLHGGGSPSEMAKVVREGVAEKGMPPWGPLLSADEVRDVVAFVRSIHGSNPAGAKEPQGEKFDWKLSAGI
jgi:cytochrome c oxidase cbb3-type subunit 3